MLRNAVGLFSLAVVACLCSAGVYAQQQIDGQKFQQYLNSQAHQALVAKTYATVPKAIFEPCQNITSRGGSNSMPLSMITFGPDDNPATGSWKQQFPLDACGEKVVLNFYFIAQDGKLSGVVGAPGDTRGSLMLQRDTVMYAQAAAVLKLRDCKVMNIKNTHYENFGAPETPDPGPNAKFRPWWETWTLIGCGQSVDVQVMYQPDATGTTIVAHLKK